MNREEAIHNLQDLWNEVYNEDSDGYTYAVAIDMAIEALKGGDAEMQTIAKTPDYMQQSPNNGADLISRADAVQLKQTDALIIANALRYLAEDEERNELDRKTAEVLREQILKHGASMCADAVGVVRCKDCKHGQYDATHYFCAEHGHKVYEDDFCSRGERRSNRGEEVNGFKSVGQAWNTSQGRWEP